MVKLNKKILVLSCSLMVLFATNTYAEGLQQNNKKDIYDSLQTSNEYVKESDYFSKNIQIEKLKVQLNTLKLQNKKLEAKLREEIDSNTSSRASNSNRSVSSKSESTDLFKSYNLKLASVSGMGDNLNAEIVFGDSSINVEKGTTIQNEYVVESITTDSVTLKNIDTGHMIYVYLTSNNSDGQ